jgi:hypothetical protein
MEKSFMRIVIQTNGRDHAALSCEVRRAIGVLRNAYIPTDGGGTISSDDGEFGAIILRHEGDAVKALETLTQAGIKAARTSSTAEK